MAKEYRFLHLGVNFKTKTPTPESIGQIESVLNSAKDWYRYAPNCWLIYTSRDPRKWHVRLKGIPWMSDLSYFICAVDLTERSGWLVRDAWDWINKDRSGATPDLGSPPSVG